MALQRVTTNQLAPQPTAGVFLAPIPWETANAPDEECRSHVIYTMSTALCTEPPGKATLACPPPAYQRTKLTLFPHSLGMGNSASPGLGGFS